MKSIRYVASALLLFAWAAGCKKKDEDPALSAKIQGIVSSQILSDLKAKGLVVNEGNQPPNVEGIFLSNPHRLLSPHGPDDNWKKGEIISDYKYRFYNQKGDDVQLEFKGGSERASGIASFLAGNGNKFSLFGEQSGESYGISTKVVSVISGELTPAGIQNFQYAFVLTEKGPDPSRKLIDVGKSRVWEDGNGQANKISTFRRSADEPTNAADLASSPTHLLRRR